MAKGRLMPASLKEARERIACRELDNEASRLRESRRAASLTA